MVQESKHELNWMPINEASEVLREFNPLYRNPAMKIRRAIANGTLPVARFSRQKNTEYLIHEEDLTAYLKGYCRRDKG
jgi:hypothetical protein